MILYDGEEAYYFNFQEYAHFTIDPNAILPQAWISRMQSAFDSPGVLFGHNLIFDLHFLLKEGLTLPKRTLWCTEVGARIQYNDHLSYSLENCGKRMGTEKSDAVKEYMDKHKLFTIKATPGKKTKRKNYHFNQVPIDIIFPYGEQDAKVCYALGMDQASSFQQMDNSTIGAPPINNIVTNEQALTRVLVGMQQHGIRLDVQYCDQALQHERVRAFSSAAEYRKLTGIPLIDSAKSLSPILEAHGILPGRTIKGGVSVAEDILLPHYETNSVAKAVLDHRDAMKRSSTYWQNYIDLVGKDGRVHAWLRQAGTATGRFGCREPNLQNLTKEDNSIFPIRRAFVPDEGEFLVSIDYAQMEYRLMLDYAQEKEVVEQVRGGMDVHEACAQMMGISRQEAKTINFALLYGAGAGKLAVALGISLRKAQELKAQYFRNLPRIRHFIQSVMSTGERRKYVFNWMGRRSFFPESKFVFKAPNYLIQGGCADIIKKAMVDIAKFLEGKRTRMLINVHDELLFSVPEREKTLVPELSSLMKRAYTPRSLPMECSVCWSNKSWHDLKDGIPE